MGETRATRATGAPRARRRLVPAVAVAISIAVGVAARATRPGPAVLVLGGVAGSAAASCARLDDFAVDALRQADVVLEGTVVSADDPGSPDARITVRADRFLRGGPARVVELRRPPFEGDFGAVRAGDALLIAASDGEMIGCGLTAPSSPELRAYYDAAF